MPKFLADFGKEVLADHVIADIDGHREPLRAGPPMAFNDDALKTQEHAAIGFGRVHTLADSGESRPGKKIAQPGTKGPRDLAAQQTADLAGRAFCRLERD